MNNEYECRYTFEEPRPIKKLWAKLLPKDSLKQPIQIAELVKSGSFTEVIIKTI